MKEGMKRNIERKQPSINDVVMLNGIPLFSFVELNINEICNRVCQFCPRSDPSKYPNQNIHMDISIAETISKQLKEIDFKGIINVSGTGEPLLTKYIVDIVKAFGSKKLHVEIVTNGDVLTKKNGKKILKELYEAGLCQFVVSMYDGPEQIEYFNKLFFDCGIDESQYTLRDRWYDESQEYGLLYTNRAGYIKNSLKKFKDVPCYYTHYSMYVDWNGDVLLCSQDMYNRTIKFGNVKEKSMLDIWTDQKMTEYRDRLAKGDRSLSPCDSCNANGRIFGHNHAAAWVLK
jgi:radical SAM protein with 4Fe4S-binding SPASM domain